MNEILTLLQIWIDKQRRCGDARMSQAAFGRFYVVYPDGDRSTPFDYRTAKNYAGIFGGHIIHIKSNKVVS